jgi:hypothetical protein
MTYEGPQPLFGEDSVKTFIQTAIETSTRCADEVYTLLCSNSSPSAKHERSDEAQSSSAPAKYVTLPGPCNEQEIASEVHSLRPGPGNVMISENRSGEIVDTVDAKGTHREFGYNKDSYNEVNRVVENGIVYETKDGVNWRRAGDAVSQPWQGSIRVLPDGTYYHQDIDGNRQWRFLDGRKVDANFAVMSEAATQLYETSDASLIFAMLAGKPKEQRDMIEERYWKQHKNHKLVEDLRNKLSEPEFERAYALLKQPDGADPAGAIRVALSQLRNGDGSQAEREMQLRNILKVMTAEQVAAMDKEYTSRYGHSFRQEIAASKMSADSKEACSVFARGRDQLTAEDYKKLAVSACLRHNEALFEEIIADAPKETRKYFLSAEGKRLIRESCTTLVGEPDFPRPEVNLIKEQRMSDYVEFGKLTAASQVTENTHPILRNNRSAIEQALETMSPEERALYRLGWLKGNEYKTAAERAKLPAEEQRAIAYFDRLLWSLVQAGYEPEVRKWHDMALSNDHCLLKSLAGRSSATDVISDIENMNAQDFRALQGDPLYRNRVLELIKCLLPEADAARCWNLITLKLGESEFQASKQQQRPTLDAFNDSDGWNGHDLTKVAQTILNMNEFERDMYRRGKQPDCTDARARLFAYKVDSFVQISTFDSYARQGLLVMLQQIERGEKPSSLVAELYLQSPHGRDLFQKVDGALEEDPILKDRLIHPKTPQDYQFKKEFLDVVIRCAGDVDYDRFIRPLLVYGHLPIEDRIALQQGIWKAHEETYNSLTRKYVTDKERDRLLHDPEFQHRVLGHLSSDERCLAMNIVNQGVVADEDTLRGFILATGVKKEEIFAFFTQIHDREQYKQKGIPENEIDQAIKERLEKIRKAYEAKYGSDLDFQLFEKLSEPDRKKMERVIWSLSPAEQYLLALHQAGDNMSGVGSRSAEWFMDGTRRQVQDGVIQLSKYMAQDPTRVREFAGNLFRAIELHKTSKQEFASTVTTLALEAAGMFIAYPIAASAATVGQMIYTSLAAGALAGAFKVYATSAIMDKDSVSGQQRFIDAGTGFIQVASAGLSYLILGSRVAKTAATKLVAEGATLLKSSANSQLLRQEIAVALRSSDPKAVEAALVALATKHALPGKEAALLALTQQTLGQTIQAESTRHLVHLLKNVQVGTASAALSAAPEAIITSGSPREALDKVISAAALGAKGAVAFSLAASAISAARRLSTPKSPAPAEATGAGTSVQQNQTAKPVAKSSSANEAPKAKPQQTAVEKRSSPQAGDTTIIKAPTSVVKAHQERAPREYDPTKMQACPTALEEGTRQSKVYRQDFEIREPIVNSFKVRPLTNLPSQTPNVVTVVECTQDRVLAETLQNALKTYAPLAERATQLTAAGHHAEAEKIYLELAEDLARCANRTLQPPGWTGKQCDNWYKDFCRRHNGREILLGDFIERAQRREGSGVCTQQALLFKLLVDKLKATYGPDFAMDAALVRGVYSSSKQLNKHAWNAIDINGRTMTIDPRNGGLAVPNGRYIHGSKLEEIDRAVREFSLPPNQAEAPTNQREINTETTLATIPPNTNTEARLKSPNGIPSLHEEIEVTRRAACRCREIRDMDIALAKESKALPAEIEKEYAELNKLVQANIKKQIEHLRMNGPRPADLPEGASGERTQKMMAYELEKLMHTKLPEFGNQSLAEKGFSLINTRPNGTLDGTKADFLLIDRNGKFWPIDCCEYAKPGLTIISQKGLIVWDPNNPKFNELSLLDHERALQYRSGQILDQFRIIAKQVNTSPLSIIDLRLPSSIVNSPEVAKLEIDARMLLIDAIKDPTRRLVELQKVTVEIDQQRLDLQTYVADIRNRAQEFRKAGKFSEASLLEQYGRQIEIARPMYSEGKGGPIPFLVNKLRDLEIRRQKYERELALIRTVR